MTEDARRVDMTFEEMRALVAQALADLSWNNPGMSATEMQHRVNLAVLNLRKVHNALQGAEDA